MCYWMRLIDLVLTAKRRPTLRYAASRSKPLNKQQIDCSVTANPGQFHCTIKTSRRFSELVDKRSIAITQTANSFNATRCKQFVECDNQPVKMSAGFCAMERQTCQPVFVVK